MAMRNHELDDLKEEFLQIMERDVQRDGRAELLEWLVGTDFFTAPASSKYHCAFDGGLLTHSMNVYKVMLEKHYDKNTDSLESCTIVCLLHDICKTQFYKKGTRNVKNEITGAWEKKDCYNIEDAFPYGHGEKSVYLIERFMRLKPSEAIAIRWHMGGFDEAVRGGSFAISHAWDKYPLAVKLHMADVEASYLREKGTSEMR